MNMLVQTADFAEEQLRHDTLIVRVSCGETQNYLFNSVTAGFTCSFAGPGNTRKQIA